MPTPSTNLYIKASAIGVLSASCLLGGYALSQHSIANTGAASSNSAYAQPTPTATANAPGNNSHLPDFSQIVEQQGPAVVHVSVSGKVKTRAQGMPFDPQDPFFEFFRRFQPPVQPQETPVAGLGSGFIVKSDGVILTNAHVVADADEVSVKLQDKREFKAKVVGIDRTSDVAVLKIDADKLPTVRIGNPGSTKVGEWVLAIGSPFGLDNTVTAGIVSAKSRTLPDDGYTPFLQTDVAINPGNSGGPLFNLAGEVIGINSQIYSRSGGYQGLSFAIPIDVAMNVEGQLLEHGKVQRARLGVMIQDVSPEVANIAGLDKPTGALIQSVEKGGPADKAGLLPGDVILSFDGKAIDSSNGLPAMVADKKPGTSAKLSIWHRGKKQEVEVRLGEKTEPKEQRG